MDVHPFVLLRAFAFFLLRCSCAASTSAANSFLRSLDTLGPCDRLFELTPPQTTSSTTSSATGTATTNVITIDSPNYPFTQYPSLSSCKYSIKAPPGFAVTVQCNINLPVESGGAAADVAYSNSDRCQTDFLYVSAPATSVSNDGYFEYFCGRGFVSRTSVFSSLTLAYASTRAGIAGYFSCIAFGTQRSCDCGWNPATRPPGTGRIVGGEEAVTNEYAGMVALVDRVTSRVFCGGSIGE